MMIYGTYGFNAFPDRHQGISGTPPAASKGPNRRSKVRRDSARHRQVAEAQVMLAARRSLFSKANSPK